MGFYSSFSEQDLIVAYNNLIEYQGQANKEILDEINKRGNLSDFLVEVNFKKEIHEERNRIIREIYQHFMNKRSKEECLSLIQSAIISNEEIQALVSAKYIQIYTQVDNLKVNSETILKSFIGTIVSSIVTTAIFSLLMYKISFISFFAFALLIPIYILNYYIIRLFTGKTRSNLAVFIATFLATILNCVYFVLLLNN